MPRLLSLLLFIVSMNLYAVELPTVIQGAENYDKVTCIASHTDTCIDAVCLTSEEIDCNEQCRQAAEDKCEETHDQ